MAVTLDIGAGRRGDAGRGSYRLATAAERVRTDPPAPPDRSNWTPADLRYVHASGPSGSFAASLGYVNNPPVERPGQRLSTAMIDEYAPYFANQYKLDEKYVRNILKQVYLYVGGTAHGGAMAMTAGTHIFVPDEADLRTILDDGERGRRWLAHELAHTMQYAAYNGENMWQSVTDYGRGIFIGENPPGPGVGGGRRIWGSSITGLRINRDHRRGSSGYQSGHGASTISGAKSVSLPDKLEFSLLPAGLAGVASGAVAGALIDASRHMRRVSHMRQGLGVLPVPAHKNSLLTGAAAVTAPLLAGSVVGMFGDRLGRKNTSIAGAVAGGAAAGAGLLALRHTLRNGARAGGGIAGWLPVAAGIGLGAFEGYAMARISSNTIGGWADSSALISMRERVKRPPNDYADAIHDAHWIEIDAEASAREYLATRRNIPRLDNSKYAGKVPAKPDATGERIDWALWNPLFVGVPAAFGVGLGVLGTRTLVGALDTTVRGKGVRSAISQSFTALGSRGQGIVNSFGVGAAVTAVPLVVGGTLGGVLDAAGMNRDVARFGAAAGAATVAGAHLTWLLSRNEAGRSLVKLSPKVLVGMGVAFASGLFASSIATQATESYEAKYRVPEDRKR